MCDLIWYRGKPKGKCWKCDSIKRRACQCVFAWSKEQQCRNYNHTNNGGILNRKTVHTEVRFVASTERRAIFFRATSLLYISRVSVSTRAGRWSRRSTPAFYRTRFGVAVVLAARWIYFLFFSVGGNDSFPRQFNTSPEQNSLEI